jgi:hypothetical protein
LKISQHYQSYQVAGNNLGTQIKVLKYAAKMNYGGNEFGQTFGLYTGIYTSKFRL